MWPQMPLSGHCEVPVWLVGRPSGALPHPRLGSGWDGAHDHAPHPASRCAAGTMGENRKEIQDLFSKRYSNYLIKGLLSLPLLASQQPSLIIRAALEAHTSMFKDILESF